MTSRKYYRGISDEAMQEIERLRVEYEKLLVDHRELFADVESNRDLTQQFQKQIALREKLDEREKEQAQSLDVTKDNRLRALQDEESQLKQEIQKVEDELGSLDRLTHQHVQRTQVSTVKPEKRVVFTGSVSVETDAGAGAQAGTGGIDVKVRIVYPMEGGTALVTFEDEKVAENIVRMKQHEIHLGDCVLRLEAKPMVLLMPSHIEMNTHVCPRSILVSDLPEMDDESRMMDRLEIHFQRKRNGGGEVESVDMLRDSGNVVVAFVEDDVAKGLTDTKYHYLDKKYRLTVTPFVNGEITDLQTRMSASLRTVLLTGIPDVMEPEDLQDCLQIHFQKGGNGGGEVDAIVYNPPGGGKLVVFTEDSPE